MLRTPTAAGAVAEENAPPATVWIASWIAFGMSITKLP